MTDIPEPYTPRSAYGRMAVTNAINGTLTRHFLATALRSIRVVDGSFSARHCMAWVDWLGSYPTRNTNERKSTP